MIATTTLFAEVLVMGVVAEVWLALFISAPFAMDATLWASVTDTAGKLSALLLIPIVAVAYAFGWVVNFIAERTFKPIFQDRLRDRIFKGTKANYHESRLLVLQKGSKDLVDDIQLDRHILRISRSGALNFMLIAVGLILHFKLGNFGIIVGAFVAAALGIVSFLQWLTRYKASNLIVLNAYRMLEKELYQSA